MGVIYDPQYLQLDTASLSHAAIKTGDRDVKEFLDILKAGSWLPFITYHHLEELAFHGDDEVFERRFAFLGKLPSLAFIRQPLGGSCVGSILDLRAHEIEFLFKQPTANHEEVIEGVKPRIRNGFLTGEQFLKEDYQWWKDFRQKAAPEILRRKSHIANVSHFPVEGGSKPFFPKDAKLGMRSKEAARKLFEDMAKQLSSRIQQKGDCKNIDPEESANKFMAEAYSDFSDPPAGVDPLDHLLNIYGVSRERLPKKSYQR